MLYLVEQTVTLNKSLNKIIMKGYFEYLLALRDLSRRRSLILLYVVQLLASLHFSVFRLHFFL